MKPSLTTPVRFLFAVLAVALPFARAAGAELRTRNVVLVTLDGARTQEIFGGLDLEVLRSTLKKDSKIEESASHRRFWAPTPEERREKLMPFLWGTLLARHGSIAGNRSKGSRARITNRHRFSYPGYSEILTGRARDEEIRSNDKIQNPHPTVLEILRRELRVDPRGVAAFASWDVLDVIVEHEAGSITANAGYEPYDHPDPIIRELSRLQREASTPWETVRHDYYTWRFARAHLETHRPRVVYIGFGETDDWAHDGNYERVLDALHRTDGYLRDLWGLLEASEEYRDRTTLLISTDHGRGDTTADWKDHGEKVEGAQHIWIACFGPDTIERGEWRDAPEVRQDQIAATMCALLGFDAGAILPEAAPPILRFIKEK